MQTKIAYIFLRVVSDNSYDVKKQFYNNDFILCKSDWMNLATNSSLLVTRLNERLANAQLYLSKDGADYRNGEPRFFDFEAVYAIKVPIAIETPEAYTNDTWVYSLPKGSHFDSSILNEPLKQTFLGAEKNVYFFTQQPNEIPKENEVYLYVENNRLHSITAAKDKLPKIVSFDLLNPQVNDHFYNSWDPSDTAPNPGFLDRKLQNFHQRALRYGGRTQINEPKLENGGIALATAFLFLLHQTNELREELTSFLNFPEKFEFYDLDLGVWLALLTHNPYSNNYFNLLPLELIVHIFAQGNNLAALTFPENGLNCLNRINQNNESLSKADVESIPEMDIPKVPEVNQKKTSQKNHKPAEGNEQDLSLEMSMQAHFSKLKKYFPKNPAAQAALSELEGAIKKKDGQQIIECVKECRKFSPAPLQKHLTGIVFAGAALLVIGFGFAMAGGLSAPLLAGFILSTMVTGSIAVCVSTSIKLTLFYHEEKAMEILDEISPKQVFPG